jgi:hypothetical protein
MSMGLRLGALGAVAVLTAGLAQAGWLALLWLSAGPGLSVWLPLVVQTALTFALAATVGWQLRRTGRAVEQSLQMLQQQVDGLEVGRTVVIEEPPLEQAQPLALGLNQLARRWQGRPAPTEAPPRRAERALQAISPE